VHPFGWGHEEEFGGWGVSILWNLLGDLRKVDALEHVEKIMSAGFLCIIHPTNGKEKINSHSWSKLRQP